MNAEGGVNGRKIDFISYDDGFSPPKTVEQARKLVEADGVLLIFQSLGTPTNAAIEKYLNDRKVPQLFVATGATRFGDPKNFPWTMGWQPTYQTEGRIYAQFLLQNYPNAKIGILYQNDNSGKDYVKGLKDGLGAKSSMVIAEAAYETSDPTVNSQIVKLKASAPMSSSTKLRRNSRPRPSARRPSSIGSRSSSWRASRTRSAPCSNRQALRMRRGSCRRPISRIPPTRSGRTIPT